MAELKGIIPPVLTLFNEDKTINWEANSKLITTLVDKGVDGIFILGSLGEFAHLSIEERKAFTEFVGQKLPEEVPLLVGVGHSSTKISQELARHAAENRADYLVAVTPYYWNLDRRSLKTHYQKLARSVDLPIVLYNFPGLTGINLEVDLVAELAQSEDNIVGIKDTTDKLNHIQQLIAEVKPKVEEFSVFAGFDHHLLSTLLFEGDGMIGGSSNFCPELGVAIYNAYQAGKIDKAVKLQKQLNQLVDIYHLSTPPMGVLKEAVVFNTDLEFNTAVRGPALSADETDKRKLKEIITNAKDK